MQFATIQLTWMSRKIWQKYRRKLAITRLMGRWRATSLTLDKISLGTLVPQIVYLRVKRSAVILCANLKMKKSSLQSLTCSKSEKHRQIMISPNSSHCSSSSSCPRVKLARHVHSRKPSCIDSAIAAPLIVAQPARVNSSSTNLLILAVKLL